MIVFTQYQAYIAWLAGQMNLQGPYTTNYVLQQAQNHPALAGVLIDEDCPDEDEDPSAQRTALPHIAVAFGAGLLLPADGLDMSRYQRQIEDFSAQLQQQGWRQQQYSEQQQVQFWRRVSELQALKASDVLAQVCRLVVCVRVCVRQYERD